MRLDHFLQFDYFGDEITVGLIMAASKCLNLPLNTVLEAFGDFFLKHCLQNGYDNMLRTLGRDMKSFIQNLDSLHALLTLTYDKLVAPSFRCLSNPDGTLTLHYYSCRHGLSDIVKGVLRAVGSEIFNQSVRLELVSTEQNDLGGGRSQEHSVFIVHFLDDTGRREATGGATVVSHAERRVSQLGHKPREKMSLSGDLFCEMFPYHVTFDENLIILQCGDILESMLGVPLDKSPLMSDAFRVIYPRMSLTLANIRHFINSIFVLAVLPKDGKGTSLSMKGQMMWLEDLNRMMYIGSPLITSLKEMKEMDLCMADIPLFDVTREIILLYEQRAAEIGITRTLDLTTAELKRTSKALEQERRKTEQLLHQMLPPKVAGKLKNGEKVDAETFQRATIMFSDVVTFTNIAAACPPEKIVNMLNDMYLRFDNATTRWDVYKVETIGDAYMVVSGVPERTKDHAQRVARFAIDIVGEAAQVTSPATGKPLQIRVGIHTGPVMAGVVGVKMPRYCLFGDTVNTASRMESHGIPGRIHLSPATFRSLKNIGFTFKRRGEVDIKGKGRMVTHFLISDGERDVLEPSDSFTGHPVLTDSDLILDDTGDLYPDDDVEEGDHKHPRESGDGSEIQLDEAAKQSTHLNGSGSGLHESAENAGNGSQVRMVKPDYSFLADSTDLLTMRAETGAQLCEVTQPPEVSDHPQSRSSRTCLLL
ncbi:guanylate cyclase soluble subunit beta-2-like isoform X2 [Pomacea canaliculata]|uniref:guanylate cyclase soluble subunit beta-2-like isoform X2 n=1 Tax=Pomacea canaliculata TaxID=400727 RepID=UPI000D73B942|nr:guanylate cyclase soluble subunit beta-2-like isoform X2 [Pomacea canaliculata]